MYTLTHSFKKLYGIGIIMEKHGPKKINLYVQVIMVDIWLHHAVPPLSKLCKEKLMPNVNIICSTNNSQFV